MIPDFPPDQEDLGLIGVPYVLLNILRRAVFTIPELSWRITTSLHGGGGIISNSIKSCIVEIMAMSHPFGVDSMALV